MTALLWSPDAPERCACAGRYRPQLNAKGKLVKSREPAWRMFEQTRDPGCLQERFRALAKFYRVDYQHHLHSRGSTSGYPDVHTWADGKGSLYAELKRMRRDYPDRRDDPSPAQVARMASLQGAGHLVYLVRPCCMLSGAVDEMLAAFTGVPCRYAGGHPDGPPTPESILAEILAQPAPPAAAGGAPAARPARKPPAAAVLPGTELGEPFPDAVGYVVPMPDGDRAAAAVRQVEAWLRDAGFPTTTVPFPMRFVVGAGTVIALVRSGLARPGADTRVWRGGAPARPFPDHLIVSLRAAVLAGPDSAKVVELMTGTSPS